MFKWLATMAIIGVIAVVGIQMVPVYIQNHAVKKIAMDVVSDAELANKPKRELLAQVQKRFLNNDIRSLKPQDIITINRDNRGALVMDVKYEERRKLLYNLNIVAAFDDQITN